MVDFGDMVIQGIDQYGLLAIFILLVLDAAMLLPFFPAEVVLIITVTRYVHNVTELMLFVAFASTAALCGSLIVYLAARIGGRPLMERYPRFFKMPTKRRQRLERVFAHPIGQTLVLWLRLFPFTRVLVNIPAGLAKMPFWRFIAMSSIGLVAFHAVFMGIAYGARQEGSAINSQGGEWADAYADPAMQFVQANALLTAILAVLVGAILSVQASRRMFANPHEASGSLLGTIAVRAIMWAGIILGVALFVDYETVFTIMEQGGLPRERLGPHPILILAGIAAGSTLLGMLLVRFSRAAKKHRRAADRELKAERKAAKAAAKK